MRYRYSIYRLILLLMLVAAGVFGTWQAYSVSRLLEQSRVDESLRDLAQVQAFRIQDLLSDAERVLEAFKAYFQASEYVSTSEYREFASILLPGRSDVYAVHWAPKTGRDEDEARRVGPGSDDRMLDTAFEFNKPSLSLVSLASDPFSFPITRSEPPEPNRSLIGLDLASRFGGMSGPLEMARLGKTYTTPAFPITEDASGPLGVAVFQPVMSPDAEQWSLQQLKGFLVLLLRPEISLTERIEPIQVQPYQMRLLDIGGDSQIQIYPRGESLWPTGPEYDFPLTLGNRRWQLDIAFDEAPSFSVVPTAIASLVAILALVILLALGQSFRQSSALMAANRQLSQLANSDPLTGLANRRRIEERAAEVFALEERDGSFSAVCVVDLDNFKEVNDSFGHQRGDSLLIELAELFRRSLRGGDVAARMGGDEFVLLMPQLKSLADMTGVLDRLVQAMDMRVEDRDRVQQVSASIGVALSGDGCRDFTTLHKRADRTMYTAKRAGKNRYLIWSADMTHTLV